MKLVRTALGVLAGCLAAAACRAADWPPAPALDVAAETDAGGLPPSVEAKPADFGRWRCTFRFEGTPAIKSVALAGTFNDWNPGAQPLASPDKEGKWSVTVELPSGTHLYKLVVDGQRWIADPRNAAVVDDNHGGSNSVLRLGRMAQLQISDAKAGDGRIEGLALEHDPKRPLYFQPRGETALFRLRTLAHDVETVTVVVQGGGKGELSPVREGEPFTLWEGSAALPPGVAGDGKLHYTFVLVDGPLTVSTPTAYGVAVSANEVFRTPDWAKHAIWYQVFLDRFRNGDPANDRPPVTPWTHEWFALTDFEEQRAARENATFYKWMVFDRQYGGDLAGLEQKLPYLKELGVNALYLNPIFKAESNHKYNAETYLHVDDHFGTRGDYEQIAAREDHNDPKTWQWTETDKQFLRFLKAAHAQGFKVILDGVFNHVGTAHPAFQDVKLKGAKSQYADWFNVTSWEPFEYEGWFGHDALPVFKKSKDGFASAEVTEYVFNVTRRWMDPDGDGDPSDGIDGWRLDVPNEVPAPFWVAWRKVVKAVNPQAYITGEIWDRAELWLDGQHFDAVMNYEFTKPTVQWMFNRKRKIQPSELDHRLRDLRLAYPLEATLVLQNLLDSHDTDRVASMALNPDRDFDGANRVQDNGPHYNNDKPRAEYYRRARLAVLLQMTYVGAPMIYYGDEVGMWGADDPTCRKPMLWEDLQPYAKPEDNFVMKDQLAYYRQAVALRNAHPALRTGEFRTLLTDDGADVYAFLRKDRDEQLVVVLNASEAAREVRVPLPASAPNKWRRVFDGAAAFAGKDAADEPVEAKEHQLHVSVPPAAGVVLHAATPK